MQWLLLSLLLSICPAQDDASADDVVSGEQEPTPVESSINGIVLVSKWNKNVKTLVPGRETLYQMPMKDLYGKNGICDSYHYNADRYYNNERYGKPTKKTQASIKDVQVVDNFVPAGVACSLTAVMQEWRKDFCKNPKMGCRFAYGDCSHKDESARHKETWNHGNHQTRCIDIRPVRTGVFLDKPLSPPDEDYDREKTKELLLLLKKHGGHGGEPKKPMFFSDKEISRTEKNLIKEAKGHHNHIHVCFTDKDSCKNLEYFPSICGP